MLLPSPPERSSPRHAAWRGNPLPPGCCPIPGRKPSARGGGRVSAAGARPWPGQCWHRGSRQGWGHWLLAVASKALAARARSRDPLPAHPSSVLPNSSPTDQLVFLNFLLLFDKHLTRVSIFLRSSSFRDVCLLQHCRRRHISEHVLLQIKGPDGELGKTCHTAVPSRRARPTRSPRGQAARSCSSASGK